MKVYWNTSPDSNETLNIIVPVLKGCLFHIRTELCSLNSAISLQLAAISMVFNYLPVHSLSDIVEKSFPSKPSSEFTAKNDECSDGRQFYLILSNTFVTRNEGYVLSLRVDQNTAK